MPETAEVGSSKPSRQRQRSEATQRKLWQSTIECIAEYGYLGTSMERVVARAGVSRGAQAHHYPAKLLLLQASFRWMLDQLIEDLRDRTRQMTRSGQGPSEVFRYLWSNYFSGRLFAVTMELIAASRTDAELRDALAPVSERFHTQVDECFAELRGAGTTDRRALVMLNITMALLRGMGVQTVLFDRPAYFREMLDEWLQMMELSLLSARA